jgi:hypothetical protein
MIGARNPSRFEPMLKKKRYFARHVGVGPLRANTIVKCRNGDVIGADTYIAPRTRDAET